MLQNGGRPVFSWIVDNIHVCTDLVENIKPDKQKPPETINGVVATVAVLGRAIRRSLRPRGSFYDTRDLLVLYNIKGVELLF